MRIARWSSNTKSLSREFQNANRETAKTSSARINNAVILVGENVSAQRVELNSAHAQLYTHVAQWSTGGLFTSCCSEKKAPCVAGVHGTSCTVAHEAILDAGAQGGGGGGGVDWDRETDLSGMLWPAQRHFALVYSLKSSRKPDEVRCACAYRPRGSKKAVKPAWLTPVSANQKYWPSYNVAPQTNT